MSKIIGEDYWREHLGLISIYNVLNLKRFKEIRALLYFNNNENMLL